ncbi:retrovirus-related pol polyprotein from transposon TNT 1-94 [Tanacetum coccineum]
MESSKKYEKNIREIVDLENAKKELENIVYKMGQTTQTMHMLTKPQRFYDNTRKTAFGYQNPLYLTQSQRIQPVLYNARALTEKHDPISVYDSKDTLITTEESRSLLRGLLKIELEPINAYFKNNRAMHRDYLRVNKGHVETLHELLEEARALKPLDEHIGHASKFVERIQELLVVSYTNASGSQPKSNTRKDRIQRPSSRSEKNKVEAQHRMFKSSSNKNNHVLDCNVNVALSKNYENICLSCNECLFSANHDACVVKYLKDVNKRLRWKPTRRMFNIDGNIIQSSPAIIVPLGNRLHTIRIPVVAPSTKTRMRYSIAKNSLNRAHVNNYVHPFNLPYWAFVQNSEILDSSSANVGFLGIIEIILWYLDSGCNNDHFAAIIGYGDLQFGNVLFTRVYYVEGLGNNLFSVKKFCDSNLEVAFRKHTCFVRNLDGVDLLSGSRGSNLYTISLKDMMKSSPICLLSKASKTKSWLWHCHLSHLNFNTINKLEKPDLVRGLPKLKYAKDHLCSACQMGKSKKESYKPNPEQSSDAKLHTLHMDLCGLMHAKSINGKRYILVIIDDCSRFTWVKFLRTKDETLKTIIKFLKQAQVSLQATVRYLRTDNETEFINQTLKAYTDDVGITHQTSVARTPQQNGVVERHNRTLVEAARTMLIFFKSPLFLWAEAVATTFLKFLHVFGALYYPTNNHEYLGKLQPKADIGIFIGYSPSKKAYIIYNKRTQTIMETIHVQFDKLTQMASEQYSSRPELQPLTSGQISSGHVPNQAVSTSAKPPSKNYLDLMFQPMFDEYFKPHMCVVSPTISAVTLPIPDTVDASSSTTIAQDAPSPSTSPIMKQQPLQSILQMLNNHSMNHCYYQVTSFDLL